MTARLLLLCHASTDAVRQSAFPADERLDARGKAAAAALIGRLPRPDRCLVSPEARTRETAEALELSGTVEPVLRDCDYGAWRGRTFADVNASEPAAVAAWLSDPAAAPHGGEAILGLVQRVAAWLAEMQNNHRQSIVVTHASIIRAAVVCAVDAGPKSFWRIDVAPLSLTRLSGANGRWNLVSFGCSPSRE